MQLRILIGRAANNQDFAKKLNFQFTYAASTLNVISRFAKLGTTSAALAKAVAAGVTRATGTVGLHITGIVISGLLIPVDFFQLIINSVKLHRRIKSEVVINTEKIADGLENELWFLLKDKSYTLAKLERYDDEKQKHILFIAGERNSVEEISGNSDFSLKEIYTNQIIVADFIREEIDPVLCEKLLSKWNDYGLNDMESKSFDVLSVTKVNK